jgi:NAD+ diphosphatase
MSRMGKKRVSAFAHCPKCTSSLIEFDEHKKYSCPACGWQFYQNTAAATAAILHWKDTIILTRRNKNPQKGKLDLVGGFVDIGESAEQALIREAREEISAEIKNITYFGSYSNPTYIYKTVTYSACDMIFTATVERLPTTFDPEEIADIVVMKPRDINPSDLAFVSMRQAMKDFLSSLS